MQKVGAPSTAVAPPAQTEIVVKDTSAGWMADPRAAGCWRSIHSPQFPPDTWQNLPAPPTHHPLPPTLSPTQEVGKRRARPHPELLTTTPTSGHQQVSLTLKPWVEAFNGPFYAWKTAWGLERGRLGTRLVTDTERQMETRRSTKLDILTSPFISYFISLFFHWSPGKMITGWDNCTSLQYEPRFKNLVGDIVALYELPWKGFYFCASEDNVRIDAAGLRPTWTEFFITP